MMFETKLNSNIKKIQEYCSTTKNALEISIKNIPIKLPKKTCPHCFKLVFGERQINDKFGPRICNYIYECWQSWCKECMSKRKREPFETLNHRRQLNKFFLFLLNLQ